MSSMADLLRTVERAVETNILLAERIWLDADR